MTKWISTILTGLYFVSERYEWQSSPVTQDSAKQHPEVIITSTMKIRRNLIRCSDFNRPKCFHPKASGPFHTCNSLNSSKISRLSFPVNVQNQLFVTATAYHLLCFYTSASECLFKIICLKWPSNVSSTKTRWGMHVNTLSVFFWWFQHIFISIVFPVNVVPAKGALTKTSEKVCHQHD